MLLLFILLYLGINIAIGAWAAKRVKSTQDFVVAGRNLPLVIAGSALFATWFGLETIMGASSEFVEHGLIGVVEDPFGAALCLLLVGLFFARPLYRLNILTLNDYFRQRFGREAEFVSAIFMVPSYFGWIAAQLVALAVILQVVIGIPLLWGILVCTLAVALYTYFGGMWAVSITDFVQTLVIIGGLLVFAFQVGGEVGSWEAIRREVPPGFFRFWPEADLLSHINYLAAWITIGLGSIPQQDVFQRVMSAKSEKVAVRASYLGAAMYLIVALIPLFIALCGKILYPELLADDPQMLLPQMVWQKGGLLLQVFFFGALLSAILSTTSGAILAPATVIGENLIKPFYPQMEDKRLLRLMRLSVIVVALLSAVMAYSSQDIFDLVAQSSALSLVSLFVPLVAGLYWKRANKRGALLAMLLGMGVWLFCETQNFAVPSLVYGLLASGMGMVGGSLVIKEA